MYLLGIDNGNTISKASLFDLNGHELCVVSRSADTFHPQPGWTERSMEALWDNTARAVRELISSAGIAPNNIAAVGCTGHGNGLYLLDKEGRPLRNGIQSLDSRAADIVREWEVEQTRERAFIYTPQVIYPAQSLPLIAWLKRHERAAYDRIGWVLMCKDYINYRLTGELVSDFTDMTGGNLTDVYNRRYSADMLAHFGIPEIQPALPPMLPSAQVIGRVTAAAARAAGLAEGTPVIAGMMDAHASALGAGAYRPGQASLVVGTWSINQVILERPLPKPAVSLMQPFAVPDYWLAMDASATAASNLEWFVRHFCAEERAQADRRGTSVYEVCNEILASIPPEASAVIFHPFLYTSNLHSNAQAGFYGVAGWHTRSHLLRAVYEGIVFSHLTHIEKLRGAGAAFDSARLTGGGARSPVWSQMFADALHLRVEVPDVYETGTRGAALAAGVGAGIYASFDEAVQKTVSISRVHEPDARRTALYRQRYAHYRAIGQAMAAYWDTHAPALENAHA